MDPCEFDVDVLLEAFPAGVILFDRHARLIRMNREAMRIFGFESIEEAVDNFEGVARTIQVVALDGTRPEPPRAPIERALKGEQLSHDFEALRLKPGEPPLVERSWIRPIVDPSGAIVGVLKFVQDVTQEYELTRRKEEFTCVTSHELRTPVTALRLAAQSILASGLRDPALLRRYAETVVRSTQRIEAIAVKLGDVAAIAAGKPIPLQPKLLRLDDLAAEVVATLDETRVRRIRLTRAPAPVRADPARVREVLSALLDNALRYSDQTAPVEIEVTARADLVEVSVEDHGIGIPETRQRSIFEPFYRAHTKTPFDRGGLGVSLYLASEIMKMHHGRIWFESTEMRGTTFHLAFERALDMPAYSRVTATT